MRARSLFRISLRMITDAQYNTGAFPASTADSHYRLCWLSDGFWVAGSLAKAGHVSHALKFYSWVSSTLRKHWRKLLSIPERPSDVIHPRFDQWGNEIEGEWGWNQIDAVSSVLFGMSRMHLLGHAQDVRLIQALARYVENAWLFFPHDHSVWEEEKEIHLASLAPAITALKISSRIVKVRSSVVEDMEEFVREERFRAGRYFDHPGKDVDFAVLNAWSFGVACGMEFLRTARRLESRLGGKYGMARYRGDRYFSFNGKEGEWPLGRLWLAYYWHSLWRETGRERFFRKFRRNISLASLSTTLAGHFPEQVMPEGAESVYDAVPLRTGRFGNAIATPLLWAHAMYILAIKGKGLSGSRK